LKTLALKANYLVDIRQAKNNLIVRPDCPDFPDALWNDVLLNSYINLDRVYAGYYALEADTQHTQSIGDVDIMVNHAGISPKTSKSIYTHGKWAITFVMTKSAVLFAYPHCGREFSDYEKFIIGQFATFVDVSQHIRIILLDRAICLRVAHSNLSLDRHDKFGDLVTHHIVIGANSAATCQSGPTAKKSQPNPSNTDIEICRRWNGGCRTSDSCKYRHICSTCSQKHQAKNCNSSKGSETTK